ncbi:MAG TPA: neutral zinc metallopeptidase [Steroidobacteraceae bacterium]|nr:neutral zinc metallopeptidase [Steroidobacteraceae bacterium]
MDIEGRRQSSNIEDQRGRRPVRTGIGLSIGGVLLLLALSYMGVDVRPFLGMAVQQQASEPQSSQPGQPYQESPQEAKLRELTAVVLADTEDAWHAILPQYGVQYVEPKLVLFTGAVQSACGGAEAAMGPFYCPSDQKVYIDLSFYDELSSRFGAPGDFAEAYVVAHEVGHHVQNLLGKSEEVHAAQQRTPGKANELSVKLELQADCYAGVWAKNAAQSRHLIEAGDIEEGLRAASAIGDDTLQRQAQGYVVPDAFTHGSSEQRVRWFKRGIENGTLEACDTFQ